MPQRFAIYYAPATTQDLWDRGVAWTGRDPATNALIDGPVAGIDRARLLNLTESAGRYGFHATIKPPMMLADESGEEELRAELARFAAETAPVDLGRLILADLDGFLALVPAAPNPALQDLASHVVETFEPFRAPLHPRDRAARAARGLTPRQEELLDAYGYPYVFDEFRFHMTLTDRLAPEDRHEIMAAAQAWFGPVLDEPVLLERLALYHEPEAGMPFRRIAEFGLEGIIGMTQTVFSNARIVLADEVIEGSVVVEAGTIAGIDRGSSRHGEDLGGDYLIPGLVELHTDHLENHYRPRPGVFWDPMAALHAHDAQIAGSGITTVFDAVRIGSDVDLPDMLDHAERLVGAIRTGREGAWLRADHFIHLRCELPSHDVVEHFDALAAHGSTKLASVMDHTPGQRQFRSLADYKRFYAKQMGRSEADLQAYLDARQAEHDRYSAANRKAIVSRAHDMGLALASHDDATLAHVEEATTDGVAIAEFPTTLEAAAAAHDAGLAILMGAPNVVRGKSHSGNISATDLVAAGLLDILSSDYVPFALLQAAFLLPTRIEGLDLSQALATVTSNPARAAGLDDRGEIAPGKRADLVRVASDTSLPVVRGVWREGQRVS